MEQIRFFHGALQFTASKPSTKVIKGQRNVVQAKNLVMLLVVASQYSTADYATGPVMNRSCSHISSYHTTECTHTRVIVHFLWSYIHPRC